MDSDENTEGRAQTYDFIAPSPLGSAVEQTPEIDARSTVVHFARAGCSDRVAGKMIAWAHHSVSGEECARCEIDWWVP